MQMDRLRIGTRGSELALAQARETRTRLMAAHRLPEAAFDIVVIKTTGDAIQDRPLAEAGGKGLFTKEIEEALLDGRIDIAVHSSKDMPTALPDGLALTCFLRREDPRDAFIGGPAPSIKDLPEGATVGSSSLRRQALIARMRPDINVVMYRGNVGTRLKKLQAGMVDGTILAYAGMCRLGLADQVTDLMSLEDFPPAPGQGAICIETCPDDDAVAEALAPIGHHETQSALLCERAFLAALDGSCRTPIAGYANVHGDQIAFSGMILSPDGSDVHTVSSAGATEDAEVIGRAAGEEVRAKAGPGFFDGWG